MFAMKACWSNVSAQMPVITPSEEKTSPVSRSAKAVRAGWVDSCADGHRSTTPRQAGLPARLGATGRLELEPPARLYRRGFRDPGQVERFLDREFAADLGGLGDIVGRESCSCLVDELASRRLVGVDVDDALLVG